jgi:hypothetical protein
MRRAGYVARMVEMRNVYTVLAAKPKEEETTWKAYA